MNDIASSAPSGVASTTAAIGCVTTCFAVASVYLMQPVLAEIGSTYGIAPSDARLAFSAASIAYAAAFFFLGPLTDRLDPRRMSMTGLLLGALALLAASAVQEFRTLLAVLAVQGVAGALVPAAMFALLPRVAPREAVGTYFGMVIAATVVGITLGRAGMSLATAHFGLRGALRLCAAILALTALVNQALPVTALPGARTSLARAYANAVRMLGASSLLRLFGTGFLLFFGYLGVLTFLTLRLHQPPFSLDGAGIGAVSLFGISAVVGAPLSGRLTARLGSLRVGLGSLAIVLLAMACLGSASGRGMLDLGIVMLFLGVFSCQPAVFVRIAERVGPDRRGAASSLYLLTCLGAGSLSSVLLGSAWTAGGWVLVTSLCAACVVAAACLLASDGGIVRRPATH